MIFRILDTELGKSILLSYWLPGQLTPYIHEPSVERNRRRERR